MQIILTIYFIRYLEVNDGISSIYNLYELGYLNGYNIFYSYVNVYNLDSVTMRLGLTKNFIFNIMIPLVFVVVMWLGYFVFDKKA